MDYSESKIHCDANFYISKTERNHILCEYNVLLKHDYKRKYILKKH